MYRTYNEAYSAHYPRYSQYYRTKSRVECEYARDDINETLVIVSHNQINEDPYVGKLYAELDAVRDRLMQLDKRGKRVLHQPA